MLTFIITTSTKLASISLFKDKKFLANIAVNVKNTHSVYIMDEISSIFSWTETSIEDVKNVIVSIGPGSFTGVRIALSIVKGMFVGREVDIYSVNELDALAFQGYELLNKKLIAMIDSNKEKIYCGIYDSLDKGIQKVTKLDDVISLCLKEGYELIGDGVINYREKIENSGINISLSDKYLKIDSQTFFDMFLKGMLKKENIFTLVPEYLEKSQAEKEKYGNI